MVWTSYGISSPIYMHVGHFIAVTTFEQAGHGLFSSAKYWANLLGVEVEVRVVIDVEVVVDSACFGPVKGFGGTGSLSSILEPKTSKRFFVETLGKVTILTSVESHSFSFLVSLKTFSGVKSHSRSEFELWNLPLEDVRDLVFSRDEWLWHSPKF